jgi:hypothetical protein
MNLREKNNCMKILIGLGVLCILVLGGCALWVNSPTKAELAAADYGVEPENPKEQAIAYINKPFDPAFRDKAVQFEGKCYKGWWRSSRDSANPKNLCFGWLLRAEVSLKQTNGINPPGFSRYTFFFQNGKLTEVTFSEKRLP